MPRQDASLPMQCRHWSCGIFSSQVAIRRSIHWGRGAQRKNPSDPPPPILRREWFPPLHGQAIFCSKGCPRVGGKAMLPAEVGVSKSEWRREQLLSTDRSQFATLSLFTLALLHTHTFTPLSAFFSLFPSCLRSLPIPSNSFLLISLDIPFRRISPTPNIVVF